MVLCNVYIAVAIAIAFAIAMYYLLLPGEEFVKHRMPPVSTSEPEEEVDSIIITTPASVVSVVNFAYLAGERAGSHNKHTQTDMPILKRNSQEGIYIYIYMLIGGPTLVPGPT